jgi:acetyl esterase/lipase
MKNPLHPNKVRLVGPRTLILALTACILLGPACASTQPTTPVQSTVPVPQSTSAQATAPGHATRSEWKDLAYATISPAEKLDLYLPSGSGPFPLIVYVHGGGFRMGDKSLPVNRGIVAQLLSRGYAVASLNYRLSGEAKFPAAIQDVKAAVRWLRAHAGEYDLDPDKFGAWGDSAGGNLVSLLGTSCGAPELEGADLGNADQSSCVQAVVDFYGPNDFLQMDQQFSGTTCAANHNRPNSPESQYIGGPIQQKKDLVKQANPITYVTTDDPPFFIQHGTKDCTVPPQQSQLLYDALEPAIGAENVTITYLQGAEHGDGQFVAPSNLSLVLDFLDKYLK